MLVSLEYPTTGLVFFLTVRGESKASLEMVNGVSHEFLPLYSLVVSVYLKSKLLKKVTRYGFVAH